MQNTSLGEQVSKKNVLMDFDIGGDDYRRDHFSIHKGVKFLESTGLFSSFAIADNQKRVISKFGDTSENGDYIPIQDEGNVVWGYYSFTTDFYKFFSPFLFSVAIYCTLVIFLYFIIRWRIRSYLELKFSSFNQFLREIEVITEKIHDICCENNHLQVNVDFSNSAEQEIINRTVSRLMNEIRRANISLREAISESEQRRFQEELTRTAMQVAHDVGSPLAVLETIVQSNSFVLPEESRVSLRNASARIRDITNSLLKKAKHDLLLACEGLLIQQHLPSLVNLVVNEKQLQYQDKKEIDICFDFDESTNHLFAIMKAADFSRMLSNIINNAVEALHQSGHIYVSLSDEDEQAVISIKDNGRGIPQEILSKLGTTIGITYGKPAGLGLGLYHAINTVESWGGSFNIQSEVSKGTVVALHLPKALPPMWFVPKIEIGNHQEIVIIDDDVSIHDVWKMRFQPFQNALDGLHLRHFYTPDEFKAWWRSANLTKHSVLYLCDYEFMGTNENGIDMITELQINYLSILVTSRFNADDIVSKCETLGIKLLPKARASSVPIIKKN